MKLRRGPWIGVKLALIASPLLVLPWLATRYVEQTQAFVLEGQRDALRVAAQAVATVLHERDDLFRPETGLPSLDRRAESLYAVRLSRPVRLDGLRDDWTSRVEPVRRFERAHVLRLDASSDEPLAFDLALGRREPSLYLFVDVTDDAMVQRSRRWLRLDRSDHLRLELRAPDGASRRLLVTAHEPGPISAYAVDESWRHALGDGTAEPRVRGTWRETDTGWTVELRLPDRWLGDAGLLRVAVADVDRHGGDVRALVGSWPAHASTRFNRVLAPSPELDRILRALHLDGARIAVVDSAERVRAEISGSVGGGDASSAMRAVREALAGRPASVVQPGASAGDDTLLAAWPIDGLERPLGAVVVEQAAQRTLAVPRAMLEQFLWGLLCVVSLVSLGLLVFAWRLGARIRRLRAEVAQVVDESGRLRATQLHGEARSGDALGDLSRSMNEWLVRLARYTAFLEGLPRTLRHELSNPLNAVSTSLQNLAHAQPGLERSPYLHGAERGVERLGEIVTGMTDAASLEEALDSDERARFDLGALVARYVANVARVRADRPLVYDPPTRTLPVDASDFRIEQLLDKLIDNAFDHGLAATPIRVSLCADGDEAVLRVANEGPGLAPGVGTRGLAPRDPQVDTSPDARGHLGLGLYVVRAIAERHGGKVDARNLPEGAGVEIEVRLPLVR